MSGCCKRSRQAVIKERQGTTMGNRDIKKEVKKKKKGDATSSSSAKPLQSVVAQPEVITKKKPKE